MKGSPNFPEIKTWKCEFVFECMGVTVGIRSDSTVVFKKIKLNLKDILPVIWREKKISKTDHWFSLIRNSEEKHNFTIYKNSEVVLNNGSREQLFQSMETQIRLTIAEFAKDLVFLHAGVVGWKGKAIVIPGKSFTGKTSLVVELVKRNCSYLSDEYAVIDKKGFVHPYPKKLSVRGIIDDYKQVDISVEELGGTAATSAMPIGYLLVTEYQKQVKKLKIKNISGGEGVMAAVANSISVRHNPQFVLEVLSIIGNQAAVFESKRGQAAEFADFFLKFLDNFEHKELSSPNSEN